VELTELQRVVEALAAQCPQTALAEVPPSVGQSPGARER